MKNIKLLQPDELAGHALLWIHELGWLRSVELARFLYPKDRHGRKYAEKVLRKLIGLRYIIARPLPGRSAGNAYVLAQRGANWLNEHSSGREYKPGTKWGKAGGGRWEPPATWRHELLCTGVLSIMSERGLDFKQEATLRAEKPDSVKHPDALIVGVAAGKPVAAWLEVENSRKSGKNLADMLRAVAAAAREKPLTTYKDAPVRLGWIAIPALSKDERGHNINHMTRIENKIKTFELNGPLTLTFLLMHERGVGVERLEIITKTYSPPPLTPPPVDNPAG